MIACPSCQDATAVEVVRDRQPWEGGIDARRARWHARCAACGAAWTVVDHV